MANPPLNFDSGQSMDILPHGMWESGYKAVPAQLATLVRSWNVIAKAWDGLKLSWVGESANEAQQFSARLQDLQRQLFGAAGEPRVPGLVEQLCVIAVKAAMNYDSADIANIIMFKEFADAINVQPLPPEDAESGGAQPFGRVPPDIVDSPVIERSPTDDRRWPRVSIQIRLSSTISQTCGMRRPPTSKGCRPSLPRRCRPPTTGAARRMRRLWSPCRRFVSSSRTPPSCVGAGHVSCARWPSLCAMPSSKSS
ncbi:hypothetical protein [Dactylosporangium sp. CA-233914]|uniref:hypothetical protein n=1 Tax=Dactylosporangium sp. CA-233914 TaxID=3239934 RepID=UPI003D8FF283